MACPRRRRTLPFWLSAALAFVIADFGFYWGSHQCSGCPFLWRFHSVHHDPERIYFLISARARFPIDNAVIRLCGLVPIFLLGLGAPESVKGSLVATVVMLVMTTWGFFIHADLKWRFGPLEWLFATPRLPSLASHPVGASGSELRLDAAGVGPGLWHASSTSGVSDRVRDRRDAPFVGDRPVAIPAARAGSPEPAGGRQDPAGGRQAGPEHDRLRLIPSRPATVSRSFQRLQQRPKQGLVRTPASDGAPVNRLSHLDQARGVNRPRGFVEFEARRVPRQVAMRDDRARPEGKSRTRASYSTSSMTPGGKVARQWAISP